MPSDAGRPVRSLSSREGSTILDGVPVPVLAEKGSHGAEGHASKSTSARLKDVADSYLRQLYGASTATRVLAAQGLGALPSFLPPAQGPDALRLAVELGVVGSLTDILAKDDELAVQEACLMALASLLLATAPFEDHSAPLKPQHLKRLGATILRPGVMAQIGYLLTATSNGRLVLAAARVMAITAPYITQSNDLSVLESRIVPALLAGASARPDPGGLNAAGSGAAVSPPTTRDAAACVLALLTLAQTTPDMYVAVCTADFLQSISVLYERCINPAQTSDVVLPADAAALLLRAVTLSPNPLWASRMPQGYERTMELNLEESDVPECLVSFVAVESANLRRLGEDLAAAAAGNAEAVAEKNRLELEHLQSQMRERRQQLAEARVSAQDARRKLKAAEAAEARAQGEVEAALARGSATAKLRQARREAEVDARAAAETAEARRRGAEEAEAAVEELAAEVAALRRAGAPLRWQSERMNQLGDKMQAWRRQYGFKGPSKVKLSRPNMSMLTQVLTFLAARVKPAPAPERGETPATAAGAPSRDHVAALQAKIVQAGLVQAVVQLFTVLSGVQSLAGELAALAGDLALQPDMEAALKGAEGQLRREAAGLGAINQRAEQRLGQVHSEAARLRKALKLELPLPPGSPRSGAMQLGPGNGLSRTVRQEDVQQRLEALDAEAGDLSAALEDSEALVEFLHDRIQAVSSAASALSDSYAKFLKAFPTQAAPSTPASAPSSASPAPGGNGGTNGDSLEQHSRALRLASYSIMAKDPGHPAGHLLGLLSRALAPVTRGSLLNLPALVRQLQGRPPDGAATASWPPPAPGSPTEASPSIGGGGLTPRSGGGSRARSRSVESAVLAAGRPSSAGPTAGRRSSLVVGASASRPGSARSAGPAVAVERSYGSGTASTRGNGGYGQGVGAASGYGGYGAIPGSGPYPTDAAGRPLRYPRDSMYGIIQATHSPMRGYSAPHNGPRFALLLRERSASGAAVAARSSYNRSPTPPLMADNSSAGVSPPELTASVSMPLAEESRRVVNQVVSSVLFDLIDADVLGPGVARASAASLTLADGLGGRPVSAYGSRRTSMQASIQPPDVAAPEAQASSGEAAAATATAAGPAGDGDMSVLDALLLQSELLCAVMEGLATLEHFARSTCRTCYHLPSTVSYASLQPGGLGPYMARLHTMWSGAIRWHPELRVPVAESVTEIAQLALVPGADFEAVYRDSGMLEVLVQMLAGGLRPGNKAATGPAKSAGAPDAAASRSGLKPRYVGRLTAIAPPTLGVGPSQHAEQAAAGQALRAISHAQSEVLSSLGENEKLLTRLSTLVLDHSTSWPARQTAADLLSDLVLGGGPGAEAAVASGAYAGLVEVINRDMYPFLNQDPRGGKETVVSALACMVSHPELLEGVVAAAQVTHGPSSGLPLSNTDQVMSAILRSLWSVCWKAYTLFISERAGHGRHVDPGLISALTSTAATAARELSVLADIVPEARRMLIGELGLRSKISKKFLQAIKDLPLNEALVELSKNIS